MPRPGLCGRSNVRIYCQLWTAYILLCIFSVNEVNLWRSQQHAAFDAVNSSLLSATSQQLCQGAVEDLERCMSRCQLWTAYICLCIFTVNEVNLWRSPQHAAFDAEHSSLLSATSNCCARGLSRIWSAACLGLVSAVAQMRAFTANIGKHIYGYVYTL